MTTLKKITGEGIQLFSIHPIVKEPFSSYLFSVNITLLRIISCIYILLILSFTVCLPNETLPGK